MIKGYLQYFDESRDIVMKKCKIVEGDKGKNISVNGYNFVATEIKSSKKLPPELMDICRGRFMNNINYTNECYYMDKTGKLFDF